MKVDLRAISGLIALQAAIRSSVLADAAGRAIRFSTSGWEMLEGDVEIRQHAALVRRAHQRDQIVHMRVGVDVVEAGPDAQLSQPTGSDP